MSLSEPVRDHRVIPPPWTMADYRNNRQVVRVPNLIDEYHADSSCRAGLMLKRTHITWPHGRISGSWPNPKMIHITEICFNTGSRLNRQVLLSLRYIFEPLVAPALSSKLTRGARRPVDPSACVSLIDCGETNYPRVRERSWITKYLHILGRIFNNDYCWVTNV